MSTATEWDVVVVGAGPAGSVTAHQLASRGRRVLMLDKARFPRPKVCGCCLNGHALSALTAAGLGTLPVKLGAVPLTRVTLAATGRTANVPLALGFALSREALDTTLMEAAAKAGATVITGVKAKLGDLTPTGRVVATADVTYLTKVVVDASGLNGQLTSIAAVAGESRIGGGTIIAPPKDYRSGVIHMATGTGGYVGLVRVEDNRLDVAAAFDPAFVRAHGGLGYAATRILETSGLPPIPSLRHAHWRGTPPLTRAPRAVAGPRWFAVGDATGYVEPFTGEGMAWGIAAAVAVAPIVDRAVDHWETRLESEWADTHRTRVIRRQALCRIAARVLRSPTLCRWAVRGLGVLPALATPIVRGLNRPYS